MQELQAPAAQSTPAAAGPAAQAHFVHQVDIHDVGLYRFKGVSFDFAVKSVSLASLSSRNTAYAGPLKSSKAKQIAEGSGLERVRRCLFSAAVPWSLVCHASICFYLHQDTPAAFAIMADSVGMSCSCM